MATKNNRRTLVTKKMLKSSLIELMNNNPISKITIKDICEQAELSRSTFYLHYKDQYDLLYEVENEVITTVIEQLKKISPDMDPLLSIRDFIEYVHKEDHIFRILLCRQENYHFQEKFMEQLKINALELIPTLNLDSKIVDYNISFVMHGSLAIIRDWIEKDFDLSEQTISDLVFDLCCKSLDE
ncbi:MAG: TetR/AcrR family transcriptional regulator [Lachnospiraceae bacterium]|nr:TetR/AcrR family transcriptional regulator [Lachnospiraceae bacterium]